MTVKTEYVVKLTPEMVQTLGRTIPGNAVINVATTTTDLQAGYMLGVQAVMNALREGFVYER